jgi:hypothetical protein
MSTIGTQLNWGASYVINDFYRRFAAKDGSERHYVIISQLVTMLLMIVSLVVTFYLKSIEDAWKMLLITGAGTGTVLLLRWFWWRINAWSEVSAMIAAAVCSLFLQLGLKLNSEAPRDFAYIMFITVGFTTIVWLVVTYFTPPEPSETLVSFCRRVQPAGPGWNRIRALAGLPDPDPSGGLLAQLANWVLGCILIYAALFGIGYLILGPIVKGIAFLGVAVLTAFLISRNLERTGWRSTAEPGSLDPEAA